MRCVLLILLALSGCKTTNAGFASGITPGYYGAPPVLIPAAPPVYVAPRNTTCYRVGSTLQCNSW